MQMIYVIKQDIGQGYYNDIIKQDIGLGYYNDIIKTLTNMLSPSSFLDYRKYVDTNVTRSSYTVF